MSTNVRFTLWLVLVALIGAAGAMLVSEGPASDSLVAQPAPVMKVEQPAVSSVADLVRLLETTPSPVTRLVFGSGKVTVEQRGKPAVTLSLPDVASKHELIGRARQAGLPVVVQTDERAGSADLFAVAVPYLLIGAIVAAVAIMMYRRRRARRLLETATISQTTNVGQTGDRRQIPGQTLPEIEKVTFNDVAGCDEAVKELKRVVKGIISRDVYTAFGADLPRGILLFGPPGTGKTLLAKAVAGECDGTMEIASGSDFVEVYVGVGASRVRELFKTGRQKVKSTGKPHVIFVDEIDAVGGKRGNGSNSGHQEREQTLNALLVELDGMKSNNGLIVIAATNRVDMLDEALLRPGRFDCQIQVDLPDKAGREKIFGIHTRKKPLAADATLAMLANRSFGYSGAEIKGACNRAAIQAAERYAEAAEQLKSQGKGEEEIERLLPRVITLADFDEGIDFVRHGTARGSRQASMSGDEKRNTAYHEAGHACVAAAMRGSDPIVKITIMSRSRALGYVQYMPNQDRYSFTVTQAVARIVTAMAGRAAQEVYLNTVDTGASNDFEQATDLARRMVMLWGMSRLGQLHFDSNRIGPDLANAIDAEVRRIVSECYKLARRIVEADRCRIESVVSRLLEKETILAPEWEKLCREIPSEVSPEAAHFDPSVPAA